MARIKESSVAEVKAAADIVEVVSVRTSLRRASSARFTGRCPFHEERTPSFSVNPVDKLFYCFGCGKGGDVVRFVQETENLDFAGAIEWLADRFHIPLEYEEATPGEDARRMYELHVDATRELLRDVREAGGAILLGRAVEGVAREDGDYLRALGEPGRVPFAHRSCVALDGVGAKRRRCAPMPFVLDQRCGQRLDDPSAARHADAECQVK